jgi:hypothetical protein
MHQEKSNNDNKATGYRGYKKLINRPVEALPALPLGCVSASWQLMAQAEPPPLYLVFSSPPS